MATNTANINIAVTPVNDAPTVVGETTSTPENVAKNGNLTKDQQLAAMLAEAALRDQIRGRMLIEPILVEAIASARSRGVEVQLLDDGGIVDMDPQERLDLLERVAQELGAINSGKVVIRSVAGEDWKLTVAAIRKDSDRPDLFLRL
mgnify:CR=1 FL=1